MAGGMHGGGCGRGCSWWGACMAGGVHGRGCAWQGVCMGVCMAGGVHGGRACMAGDICGRGSIGGRGHGWLGGMHAWQERQPLQRTVRILLECILVSDEYTTSIVSW